MTLRREIDRCRAQLWIEDLLAQTGLEGVYALGAALDPKSVWIDASKTPHQSKWYRFKKGQQVPSNALVERVKAQVPSAAFDIRHPLWRLMRQSVLSLRSLRRFMSGMPEEWRAALVRLMSLPTNDLVMGRELVSGLNLEDMSYLDAALLIECARRQTGKDGNDDKAQALTALHFSMPLLFSDDQIWWRTDEEFLARMFALFDRALGLETPGRPRVWFPIEQRLLALMLIQGKVLRHVQRHPRALATVRLRRRYIARLLGDPPGLPFRIGTSAFKGPSSKATSLLDPRERPVDERLWRWAWHELRAGDPVARHIDRDLVDAVWALHLSEAEEH